MYQAIGTLIYLVFGCPLSSPSMITMNLFKPVSGSAVRPPAWTTWMQACKEGKNIGSVAISMSNIRKHTRMHSTKVAFLVLTQKPRVSFLTFLRIFLLMVLRFIDGGQWLDNVNQTHLVVASGMLVLKKHFLSLRLWLPEKWFWSYTYSTQWIIHQNGYYSPTITLRFWKFDREMPRISGNQNHMIQNLDFEMR